MCNECGKEFQGWCRAFTATEVILSILQAILLTLFVAFLTFLILHFIVCAHNEPDVIPSVTPPTKGLGPANSTSTPKSPPAPPRPTEPGEVTSPDSAGGNNTNAFPLPPDIACTWTPSAKTGAVTHYFEHVDVDEPGSTIDVERRPETPPSYDDFLPTESVDNGVFDSDQFDGEPAGYEKRFIVALVKSKPPDDIIFGCVLTVISEFWTLTAASCIESIEEVDSLDSFVIVENFGEPSPGRTHPAIDVIIHPQYRGTNTTYDIAALKSGNKLRGGGPALRLPTMLDYLLLAIGERLTILGFGKFRSIERDAFGRRAHAVSVHVVPGAQCGAGGAGAAWSARHLAGGAPAGGGRCGARALCAGPLRARGLPCNYCAGTPLLRARTLLGLMAAPGACGAPCEPALYVNLAASQDWLRSVLDVQ